MLKITLSFACGAVLSLALYLLVFNSRVAAPPLEVSQGLAVRIINPNNKTGRDNPDQRYLIAILDGNHHYRIWGSRGTSRRLDFVLYEDVVDAGVRQLAKVVDPVHFEKTGERLHG